MAGAIILIFEDNNNLAECVHDLLDDLGFQVAFANDGFASVSMVEKTPFDITLMDIKMPGMNRGEVYKRLKEINPQIEAIMKTGYSDEDLIKEAMLEGAHEFMNTNSST